MRQFFALFLLYGTGFFRFISLVRVLCWIDFALSRRKFLMTPPRYGKARDIESEQQNRSSDKLSDRFAESEVIILCVKCCLFPVDFRFKEEILDRRQLCLASRLDSAGNLANCPGRGGIRSMFLHPRTRREAGNGIDNDIKRK